jgi:predicted RNA-binding protein (virulence factor B family)
MIKIGEINSFIVLRTSDLGYMLSNKDEQVLLHFNQTNGMELEEGEMVECFVQFDSRGRLSATLEQPTVTMSKPGWATVVEANARLGIFVSINTFKDILISKDYLPQNAKIWPEVGDKLFVKLVIYKDELNALLMTKNEIIELNPKVLDIPVGTYIDAHICRVTPNAINAVTEEGNYIYISNKQFRGTHRIGEPVSVMIIGRHEDELVGSLNKVKEELVVDDEKIIMNYLKQNQGMMPYTAKTSAEIVEEVFHMSRKAFKRALGDLYKKREIYFDEENTYIGKK